MFAKPEIVWHFVLNFLLFIVVVEYYNVPVNLPEGNKDCITFGKCLITFGKAN